MSSIDSRLTGRSIGLPMVWGVTLLLVSSGVAAGYRSDSPTVRAVEEAGSAIVSQTAGQTIDAAGSSAVEQLLGTPGPGGPPAFPPAANLGGPIDAPSGLGGPGSRRLAPVGGDRVAPALQSPWRIWTEIRGTDISDRGGFAEFRGDQTHFMLGVGRRIGPDAGIGVLIGHERFDYDTTGFSGRLKGDGQTIGVYGGARLAPGLLLDGLAAYSRLDYDATGLSATGSFDADRWLFSGGLTARHPLGGGMLLEPSARIIVARESQETWVDSFGTVQAARDATQGRASVGARVIGGWTTPHGFVAPFAGLYGDYYFVSDARLPSGLEGLGLSDGWSLRGVAGVSATLDGGLALSLSGDIGGVGSDYLMRSVRAGASLPF